MPFWCANSTNFAPGSATPGQPASLIKPTSWPANNGFNKSGRDLSSVCSFSRFKVSSRTGLAVLMVLKKCRADFSLSTTKVSSVWAMPTTSGGNTRVMLSSPNVTGIK